MTVPRNSAGKLMQAVFKPDTMKFRGELYDCVFVSFYDDETGESFTTTESDAVWFNQLTNQYREKHGIPYVDEIIALRERYGISATKMAQILGFGTNQYRLYEEGEVPSESNGKTIRSVMNPMAFMEFVKASRNQLSDKEFAKISVKVEEVIAESESLDDEQWAIKRLFRTGRGKMNGFAPQSALRLKNLLLYVLETMGDSFQTKMNKVLFYIDFLSYRERGIAISGLAYQAIAFGPVPLRWDRVFSGFDEIMPQTERVKEQEGTLLTAKAKADMRLFSAEEVALIDTVCEKLKGMSSGKVSELSHQEPAWQNHFEKPELIPFEEAFSLKLF